MKKFASHFLAFLCGALIVGLSGWFVATKTLEMFIFETSLTNQKTYLTVLKFLRNNEVGKAIDLMEFDACLYYQLTPEQKQPITEEKTEKYFLDFYPKENSPCTKVPDLKGSQ